MKSYKYEVLAREQYKVTKVDDKFPRGDKRRYTEYLVDLQNGEMLCDCKGFYFKKKACKHIKFILAQLSDKGGILDFGGLK